MVTPGLPSHPPDQQNLHSDGAKCRQGRRQEELSQFAGETVRTVRHYFLNLKMSKRPEILLPGIHLRITFAISTPRVHSNTVHNCYKLEMTQVSINKMIFFQKLGYSCPRILHGNENE